MKSIQTKILVVVIAGLLVITVVVSAIAVNMTHEVMHKDADRILNNVAQKEAAYINDMLGDVVKSCGIMEHYAKTGVERADDLKNEEFRAKYIEEAKAMFAEIAVNTGGIQGYFMRTNPEYSNSTSGFYMLIQDDGNHKSMPLTDLDKYHRDDKQNVGWYYEAVNAGKGVWLDPYQFPGNEDKLISFVEPIYVGRELIGVIGFDMSFDYLIEKIETIEVYEYGYAALLAKDGKTGYTKMDHHDSEEPHADAAEAKAELKNGMFLAVHADYQDIQRDIRPMLSKIVFAFIAVLFCSTIYTVIVTRKIVGPLKNLTAAAETLSVGAGDVNFSQISIESKDEIGTLSKALSDTYAKIQEYTTYINALAYRDSLTGIKNSTAYAEAIADLNKDILTGNPKFGVLVADINNLKKTNDKYGHDIGNELIVHTSKILTESFKNSTVFRIGGDEFVVLLRDEDYTHYRSLLEKMDTACSADFITVCESTIPVSVARGVALYDATIDRVYEDVFAKADHAMYLNKEQIKSSVC